MIIWEWLQWAAKWKLLAFLGRCAIGAVIAIAASFTLGVCLASFLRAFFWFFWFPGGKP